MKIGLYLLLILFISLVFGCSPRTVISENIVFIIDTYSGDVNVTTDDGKTWKKAEAGFVLRENYQVRTGSDSFCDIIMPDRGIFRIADNTIVLLSKLKKQMEDIKVHKGKIFAHVTKKLRADEMFLVETETAVVSVRGTEFMVDTDGDKTVTAVKEGEVKVRKNIELKTGDLDPREAEKLIEVSVKQDENLAVDSKGNRETEKELNGKLSQAKSIDDVRKVLVESSQSASKEVKKTADPEILKRQFSEIDKPEKLQKIDSEAERLQKEKEAAEDKKALEGSVKNIQQKAGLKDIAGKKVNGESTTAEQDSQSGVADKKAQEVRDRLKSKKGQNSSSSDASAVKKSNLKSLMERAKKNLKSNKP